MPESHLTPVILCGGSGTRLWPLSRVHAPKQFVDLGGGRTLFGDTLARARRIPEAGAPIIVTNEHHRFSVLNHLAKEKQDAVIILEPSPRNTAAAIALAAMAMSEQDDDLMLVLPSDHVITEPEIFCQGVPEGIKLAAEGHIVTFGIVPKGPETGYGYIEGGASLGSKARRVERFIEKPDRATAEKLVASGKYSWNSGMFLFRARVFLEELAAQAADIYQAVATAWQKRDKDGIFIRPEPQAFTSAQALSIDYAVMEKTQKACVLALATGWSDLGSWEAFYQNATPDAQGNVCAGDVICEESTNNYLKACNRLLAVVGVDNLAIVETADAVLVASRDHVQSVKKIVDRLKKGHRTECEEHRLVHRPWGSYETLVLDARFQVKRIIVNPKAELSLQMHHHRAEHWVVVSGTAEVTKGESVFLLTENESTYIPLGQKHRLRNPGIIPLVIIEIQSGSYLGEDDIVRFEDRYGRSQA